MAIAGSNRLPVFSTPKQRTKSLRIAGHNDLPGLEPTSALQACDEGRNGGIEAHRGQCRHVECRSQLGIADFGDARRAVDRGPGPMVARIEPRILIHGARAVVGAVNRPNVRPRPWLTPLLARRPIPVAATALAHKTARIVWAMLVRGET